MSTPVRSRGDDSDRQVGSEVAPAIIRVKGLTAAYDDETVLDDISFEVHAGEVFGILGGSGSGKSTLLKHVIGLYEPVGGEVWIGDEDIVVTDGAARDALLRRIGVMYQSGALFGSLTVAENVGLPLREFTRLPAAAIDVIVQLKLALVGLEGAGGKLPSEISGGMKKRAAMARAMALDPTILFLDEPSAGLDPITSRELDELILSLRDALGITFVIVTHELDSVFAVADRVIMLDKRTRKIGAEGAPETLARESPEAWVRSFLGRSTAITEASR